MASGFLPDDELTATNLPEHVFTSDILRLILQHRDSRLTDVEQREDVTTRRISAVRNLSLALFVDNRLITTNARDALCLINSQQHVPHLSPTKSKIVFYRNGLAIPYDLSLAITLFETRKQQELSSPVTGPDDIALPSGDNYPVSSYYPIQQDLPVVYGVGYAGLPETATVARHGQALQLQGYLFFFEQLTAGLSSQLANAEIHFFPPRPMRKGPYSSSRCPTRRRYRSCCAASAAQISNSSKTMKITVTALRCCRLLKAGSSSCVRRNRILNHLLAMFGEDMYDTTSLAYHEASIVPNAALLPPAAAVAGAAGAARPGFATIDPREVRLPARPACPQPPPGAVVRAIPYGMQRTCCGYFRNKALSAGSCWTYPACRVLRHAVPVASEAVARMNAATAMAALCQLAVNFSTRVEGASLRVVLKPHPDEDAVAVSPDVFPNPAAATVAINAAVDAVLQRSENAFPDTLERRLHHLLEIVV